MKAQCLDKAILDMEFEQTDFKTFHAHESQWRNPRVLLTPFNLYAIITNPVSIAAEYRGFVEKFEESRLACRINVRNNELWFRKNNNELTQKDRDYIASLAENDRFKIEFLSVDYRFQGFRTEGCIDFSEQSGKLVSYAIIAPYAAAKKNNKITIIGNTDAPYHWLRAILPKVV